jgi:Holliday junction DNA helicase RuvA
MYDSVRGVLKRREPDLCVVEVGGLGYALHVPLSTFERLPRAGEEVVLLLHVVVREDEWRLFAFASEEERGLFRSCLKVAGVGPVTALALLSGMRVEDLSTAVSSGDVKALTRVKGVGRKTAERLVVELKDVLGKGVRGAPGSGLAPLASDAARALVALGLDPAEAEERVRRHWKGESVPLADLVRQALRG